jgi:hypothetical protein
MKTKIFFTGLMLAMLMSLQSCEVVGGIFKAGMTFGILAVVLVIGVIIFIVTRMGKK